MTNGLDEVDHFDLYDGLGSRLAASGLPAVLLPLPDHLNRHTRFRVPHATYEQLTDKPSKWLMNEHVMLYERYRQFQHELRTLVSHLRGDPCPHAATSCSFYRTLFSEDVRVSYLGYSLGAASMLCDFLERHEAINACFLLSPAIKLRDISPDGMFDRDTWKRYIKEVEKSHRKHPDRDLPEAEKTYKLFEEVFLGQFVDTSSLLLRQHGRRVLFLFGANDRMISPEHLKALSPEGWGLGMVALPGINHFLQIDEEWKKWIELVTKLICYYEENAAQETITEEHVLRVIRSTEGHDAGALDALLLKAKLLGWDGRRLYEQKTGRERLKKELREKRNADVRFLELAYRDKFITFEEYSTALARHEASQTRVGDILVEEMKVMSREHVETLATAQVEWRKDRSRDARSH